MSWHLGAYTVLIGQTVNTDVPALTDPYLTINNNHFLLREQMTLINAWVASATLLRVRWDSPTLRFYGNPFIRPVNVGTLPVNNPNVDSYPPKPMLMPAFEEIAMQATSGLGAGTERFTGLVWLSKSIDPPPAGNAYRVRATSTTAAVANVWTQLTYTFDQAIPTGRYAMISSEHQSTNAFAHRWIFDEQVLRPGFLSINALGNRSQKEQYDYDFGMLGYFVSNISPRLEVLCNAADAVHEMYVEIVKV